MHWWLQWKIEKQIFIYKAKGMWEDGVDINESGLILLSGVDEWMHARKGN